MRRKLSKQLMGMARSLSVGQPERRLLSVKQQAYDARTGKPYTTTCAQHDPRCTRAVYQLLKRNLKRTRHGQAIIKATHG